MAEVSAGGRASDVPRPGHSVMVIELSNITVLPVTECHLHQHTLPLLPVPVVLFMWVDIINIHHYTARSAEVEPPRTWLKVR